VKHHTKKLATKMEEVAKQLAQQNKDAKKRDRRKRQQERRERYNTVSNVHEHTLSPGCWCEPIIMHVGPDGKTTVSTAREASRLAHLGITDVTVNPSAPPQGR
jgi:hypothetical protein